MGRSVNNSTVVDGTVGKDGGTIPPLYCLFLRTLAHFCSFPCVSTSCDYNSSLTCAKWEVAGSSLYLICGLLQFCILSFTTPPFVHEVSPSPLAGTEH